MEKVTMYKANDGELYYTEEECVNHENHVRRMKEMRQKKHELEIYRKEKMLTEYFLNRKAAEIDDNFDCKITIFTTTKEAVIHAIAEIIQTHYIELQDVCEMTTENCSVSFRTNADNLDYKLSWLLEDCIIKKEYNGEVTAVLNAEEILVA